MNSTKKTRPRSEHFTPVPITKYHDGTNPQQQYNNKNQKKDKQRPRSADLNGMSLFLTPDDQNHHHHHLQDPKIFYSHRSIITSPYTLDLDKKISKRGLQRGRGFSPVASEFFLAVYRGRVPVVREFLDKDKSFVNMVNPSDLTTPLHHAAAGGHVVMVKFLLGVGAVIDAKDDQGFTPLHFAAMRGKRSVALTLIEEGAPFGPTDGVPTVLDEAVIRGDISLASILLEKGAKCHARSIDKHTALHHAASAGYRRTLSLLLSEDDFKQNIDAKTSDGNTALHLAVSKNRPTCAQLLIANGSNVNERDARSRTSLHIASQRGYLSTVKVLLDCKKLKIDKMNKDGRTALYLAVASDYIDIVQLLLSASASLSIPDQKNLYPIHVACQNGTFRVLKALLKSGANASVTDKLGETPLAKAAERGYADICNYLSETGGVDIGVLYSPKNHIIQPLNKEIVGPVDHYGWYIEHRVSQQLQCANNPPEVIKPKYEKQCSKIFSKWGKGKNHKQRLKKLRMIIVQGHLPKDMRGQFWKLALGIELFKQENINYQRFLEGAVATKDLKQIDKDVARTMRTHKIFSVRYGEGQMKLFRILRAYAAYDIEIGYVQSMSTITAMLLLFIPEEEDCFLAMVLLFRTHGLRYMLIRDLEGLRDTGFVVFEKLLAHFFPEVWSHFDMIGLHPSLFLTNWLLELFFGYLPFSFVLQLWDLILLDGYSTLYSFIITIISNLQDVLLQLKDPESFNDIKHMPTYSLHQERLLLNTITKFRLSPEKIHSITGLYPHP